MNNSSAYTLMLATVLLACAAPACAQRTLSDDQRQALQERLKAADTNGDGLIDRTEAEANLPRLAKHFDKLDANGDGKLSPEEMRAMAAQMAERRRNR
jgi:Ca2+-binding EF-hand superfamily protein